MAVRRFHVLERLIREHGWTRGAEIGLFKGATFFHLLDHCPRLRLMGVDSWQASPVPHRKDINVGRSTWHSPEEMQALAERVKARARRYPHATVLHMDSVTASMAVDAGSLDFVFIDADHSTEGVLRDFYAWAPKVREGGWILGHDEQWPSVRRALKRLAKQWTVHQDNVWSMP